MKSGISHQYQYVKLDTYYYCLQQNPVTLAWILFLKRDDLTTIQPWLKKNFPRWKTSYYRYQWKIFKRNLINLLFFMGCRLNPPKADFIYLPVYGQFGMSVHKGYKIFNLRSGVVTKIFGPEVNKSVICKEIDQLKEISQIGFAPSLRRWDSAEGWYEEDYVRGAIASEHRANDSEILLKAFYRDAAPCMKSLRTFQSAVKKELVVYLEELKGLLDVRRVPEWNAYSKEAEIFISFINMTFRNLKSEGNCSIELVFTHGDFCPANILSTSDGIRILDWENAGYRSLLFDFYSYFFYRPVNIDNISVDKMRSELCQSLPVFISQVDKAVSDKENVYRRLYYLEYLSKLVERLGTDRQLNIMDYIIRYIDAFSRYEQNRSRGSIMCRSKSAPSADFSGDNI